MMELEEFLAPPKTASTASPKWVLPPEHDHLSVTQLNLFQRCERAYQQRYILKRETPPSSAQIFGKAIHESIRYLLGDAIQGSEISGGRAKMFFEESAWPTEVDAAGGLGEISWEEKLIPDEIVAMGGRMIETYADKVAPRLQPAELEKRIQLDIPGVPIPIVGFIDITQREGRPAIDVKTSSKAQNTIQPDWLLQGRVYQLAEHREIDWHILTKQVTPQAITSADSPALLQTFTPMTLQRTEELIRRRAWRINHLYSIYGPDEPWDWTGISHTFACRHCSYRIDCPGWEGAE